MRQKLILLFLACFPLSVLSAQENLGAAGEGVSGSEGAIHYTLGQLVYNNSSIGSGSVVHGVHQPFGIAIADLEEADIKSNITLYPNPTTRIITLSVEYNGHQNIGYELYSSDGKLVDVRGIAHREVQIDMNGLMPSIYILKIISDDKELNSFKVIKQN